MLNIGPINRSADTPVPHRSFLSSSRASAGLKVALLVFEA